MKVVWLASWYPNTISPLEGDFVQRHAIALSQQLPLTVIYLAQYGTLLNIEEGNTSIITRDNLTEIIIHFRFRRTGIKMLDKIIYNWKYYSTYKKFINAYFAKKALPDLVHVHVPMKAGLIAKWIKKKWQIPYIVSEHSATYVPGPPDTFQNRSAYYRNRVKSVFNQATTVTSVSAHDGKLIKDIFSLKEVFVIHNVVNTNFFYYKPRMQDKKIRFIHVSVMSYQKNMEGILRACAALGKIRQDWEIELIGNDSAALKELVNNMNLSQFVIFKGEMSNQMVAIRMQKAAALVMFSRYENFPCVIIEALCCGLPVIASDVAGIPEAVNSSNGLLVPSENETELLNALIQFMNNRNSFNRAEIAATAL